MQERYEKGVNKSEDGLKAFESRFVAKDERIRGGKMDRIHRDSPITLVLYKQ